MNEGGSYTPKRQRMTWRRRRSALYVLNLIVVCLCLWWAQANPGTSTLLQSDQSQRPIGAKTVSDWPKVLLSLVPVPLNGYLTGPSWD